MSGLGAIAITGSAVQALNSWIYKRFESSLKVGHSGINDVSDERAIAKTGLDSLQSTALSKAFL